MPDEGGSVHHLTTGVHSSKYIYHGDGGLIKNLLLLFYFAFDVLVLANGLTRRCDILVHSQHVHSLRITFVLILSPVIAIALHP